MKLRLEKMVDGIWYPWGTYDMTNEHDRQAFCDACSELGQHFKIRALPVEE